MGDMVSCAYRQNILVKQQNTWKEPGHTETSANYSLFSFPMRLFSLQLFPKPSYHCSLPIPVLL